MVEENEPKKRKGLFGTRKTSRKATPAVPSAPAAAPEVPNTPEATAPEVTQTPVMERKPVTKTVIEPTPDIAETETPEAADEPAPVEPVAVVRRPSTSLIFQAPAIVPLPARTGTRQVDRHADEEFDEEASTVRRRARRRTGDEGRSGSNDPANTVVKVRTPREPELITEPQRIKGSTRLEAKKQRRRDGRDAGRRRPVVTEAEFLARRESVDRTTIVRSTDSRRARNSASVTTGRRRPAPRPSRRRCFLASSRVEPLMRWGSVISSGSRGVRTLTTVFAGSFDPERPSSPVRRRARRRTVDASSSNSSSACRSTWRVPVRAGSGTMAGAWKMREVDGRRTTATGSTGAGSTAASGVSVSAMSGVGSITVFVTGFRSITGVCVTSGAVASGVLGTSGAAAGALGTAGVAFREVLRVPNRPLRFLGSFSSTITGALLDRRRRPRHPPGYSLVRRLRLRATPANPFFHFRNRPVALVANTFGRGTNDSGRLPPIKPSGVNLSAAQATSSIIA